jgi:NAD(P)-dependent dehydrogenase (short-subunit alcohol dehydrogenase family)
MRKLYILAACLVALWYLKRRLDAHPYHPKPKKVSQDAAILVTGCDSGFGRASVIELAKKGYRVYAGCLTEKGKGELAGVGYPRMKPFILDVTKTADIEAAVQMIEAECTQGLFCLVNNAGIYEGYLFDWNEHSLHRKTVEVNLLGVLEITKAFLPLIIKAKGRIVNVASLAGLAPFYGGVVYTATKHAIMGFTKALKIELFPFNVDVIAICPGFTRTDLVTNVVPALQKKYERLSPEKKKVYDQDFMRKAEEHTKKIVTESAPMEPVIAKIVESAVDSQPKSVYYVSKDAFLLKYMESAIWWFLYWTLPYPKLN